MNLAEKFSVGVVVAALASPAFAGGTVGAPAPAIGIGVGAVVLMAAGYRALKSRIDR